MKKVVLMAALLSAALSAAAQDNTQSILEETVMAMVSAPNANPAPAKPKYWTTSLGLNISTQQTTLTNWAAGGYNTVSLATGVDAKANYAKNLTSMTNRLQMDYGFLWSKDKAEILQKNKDRIYFETKFGYRTKKDSKWNYSASADIRSQFSNGYNYKKPSEGQTWRDAAVLKSGFMSPGYVNLALGLEWKPKNWFNVNIAPLTGGYTVCRIESLRKSYGMKLRSSDLDPSVGSNYRSALFQFGAQVKMNAKFSINDIFKFDSQLVLFTDYLAKPFVQNRINWDNNATIKLGRFFNINLSTWLIYDPIVSIDGVTSKVQFKEYLSFAFAYSIASKKK